jgi:phospholipid N-methyltransferase
MSQPRAERLAKSIAYVSSYLKDLRVAALAPSSPRLIARLVRHLKQAEPQFVVELGPGDGVATREVLAMLPPNGELIVIERNPEFAAALRKWTDSRLRVIEGDATQVATMLGDRLGKADAIIASIPFTYLTPDARLAVVEAAHRLLRPEGTIIVFHQYSTLMRPILRKVFGKVQTEFEPRNVMPAYLLAAKK